jgi:hypothetical protein
MKNCTDSNGIDSFKSEIESLSSISFNEYILHAIDHKEVREAILNACFEDNGVRVLEPLSRREMQMKKVIISNEEANALEIALEMCGGDKASVSQYHGVEGLWEGKRKALNDLDLETVNIALYVGYEVEPGPEEKVLEYYNELEHGFARGAVTVTLNILNIQIKGINC